MQLERTAFLAYTVGWTLCISAILSPPSIEWDRSSLVLVEANAHYARIVRHPNGTLFACYDRDHQIWVEPNHNEGKSWDETPTAVYKAEVGNVTNAELLPLQNGTLLCFFNHRPFDDKHPYAILASRSADLGKTWSPPEVLFAARETWGEGCWEPAAIEHPSGEIQVFFANEQPFPDTTEQEISMMRSLDQGLTWEPPKRVIFRAGHRDGMPVPCLLQNGSTAVAIEDNGMRGPHFKPVITVSKDFSRELHPISGTSLQRWSALRKPLEAPVQTGAPYLRQMPTGETILSFQQKCKHRSEPNMVVCVGTSDCRDFDNPTEPFPVDNDTAARWNSLFVKSTDVITAVSDTTIDGKRGVWAIDGKLQR